MRSIRHFTFAYAVVTFLLVNPQRAASVDGGGEAAPPVAAVVPIGPDQLPEDAKLELAKAGAQQFLNEIVGELVLPTNSPAFMSQPVRSPEVANEVKSKAFDKLAAIRSPSTVLVVASFLSDTMRAMTRQSNVVSYVSFAEMAGNTLGQIVTNPPPTSGLNGPETINVWQQWWEQNKDKYP